jgi:acetylornithine deacetylase/succinyl-diaminopimelate desuccinylase-like protein
MLNPAVKIWLDDHRQDHLDQLMDLLRFPSIANVTEPDHCTPCAQWLIDWFTARGFSTEQLPGGGPPYVLAERVVDPAAPTVLLYGHYDVQPPEPLDLWESPPFEPVIKDGWLVARGANDDKGQLFAHLMAIDAWTAVDSAPPVNIKFLIDGEEEIGSPHIEPFLQAHAGRLAADALALSDTGFYDAAHPSITTALRGLCYFEVTCTGPSHDLHSGLEGGLVANPAMALARLIGRLHDDAGHVTIPGFYDDVVDPSAEELRQWQDLGFDAAAHAAELGLDTLGAGEAGLDPLVRNWARPTVECNGIGGGYTGPGSKTIIPARASAKISMRLVAKQDPDAIDAAFRAFIAEHTPAGITTEVTTLAHGRPVLLATDSPAARAGRDAMAEAFAAEPTFIRCGASVPIVESFQRHLGLDAVLLGLGLPDDRLHSPNEQFKLSQLYNGSVMSAAFLQNLRDAAS